MENTQHGSHERSDHTSYEVPHFAPDGTPHYTSGHTSQFESQHESQRASHDAPLTSSEIASLWTQYQLETMLLCVNRYMHYHIQDPDVKKIFDYAIHLGEQHKGSVEGFFTEMNFPIPHGFTEQDVQLDAPRLFSDELSLFYLFQMTVHAMSSYGVSLAVTTRKDIRQYLVECSTSSMELYNRIADLMLERGTYQRPPYIPIPVGVDFIDERRYTNAWMGERRPLNAIEISEVFFNLKKNMLTKTMALAFHQVTKPKELKKHIWDAVELANKHIYELGTKLQKDHLPVPSTMEDQITNSTVSPFSERLIMYHLGFLHQTALAYFGSGAAVSMRPDLAMQYEKIIAQVFKSAAQWSNVMIKKGWLEQPPQAEDRKALSYSKQ